MKTIYVGLTKSKKKFPIMSWIIKWCEGTDFSHVMVYWVRKNGGHIYYQSTGHGVNFCGTQVFDEQHKILRDYKFELQDDNFEHVLDYCIDNSGKSYSCLSLIGLGLMRLCKLFGFVIKNPFKDGDASQICVETVLRITQKAGIDLGLDPDESGLMELEKALLEVKST